MKSAPLTKRLDDNVTRGMDMGFTIVVLAGIGYLLDRWLGTTPWLTIALVVVAGVGVFATLKYRYEAAMAEHARERSERAAGRASPSHQQPAQHVDGDRASRPGGVS